MRMLMLALLTICGAAHAGSRAQEQAGYTCESNGRTWVQVDPCPLTTTTIRSEPVTVTDQQTGRRLQGSTTVREKHAVREADMDRDEICERLKSNPNVSQKRTGSADSAYERNKLRQQNGC